MTDWAIKSGFWITARTFWFPTAMQWQSYNDQQFQYLLHWIWLYQNWKYMRSHYDTGNTWIILELEPPSNKLQNETHVSFISKLQLKQFQEDNFDDLDASYWFDSAVSGMKSMFSPIIPFQCTFPVNEYVRGDFRPIYTEQEIIEEGRYAAEILLYKTDQYQSIHVANPTMDAFDEFGMTTRVNAEVRLQNATHAENIAIQINRCWATPTNGILTPPRTPSTFF